ncbi:MAG: quinone-dependent dihydroorotate dehydrogenase [Ignavibacteria bacterium]|jgi:dihydroorotate dehydrogenase
MFYKLIIRPVLFLFNPELIHGIIFFIISKFTFLYPAFSLIYSPKENWEEIEINGLRFRNRLGIAAGLDKDGVAVRFFDAVGFSHIEVGTVTPLPQPGNDKPRLFRLKKDKALINRMGFNNIGADEVKKNILKAKKHLKRGFVIGVNIGKNKNTPLETAFTDYEICLDKLYDVADYFTVNISSPNTEGLRNLQSEKYLDELLQKISDKNKSLSVEKNIPLKNIFIKIAPDLSLEEVGHIYFLASKYELTGIATTNTTITRNNLIENTEETGGLSGKPLKDLSDKILKQLKEMNDGNTFARMYLIGSGGVFTRNDYKEKLINGADLVQVYTGYIYEGNSIIKKILN